MCRQTESGRRAGRFDQLVDRPGLTGLTVAAYRFRSEPIEGFVIGRVHRNKLTLQMSRQLGQRDAGLC